MSVNRRERFPDQSKKRKNKNRSKKPKSSIRQQQQMNAAIQSALAKERMKTRVVKYYDLDFSNGITTSGEIVNLTQIPQGAGQSQRVADTVFLTKIELKVTILTANSDVTNVVRAGLFKFLQNTTSVTPSLNSFYENSSTYGPLCNLNFEGRQYFRLFNDRILNMSGTASAPTIDSLRVLIWNTSLRGTRIDFQQGTTTGVGHIYFVTLSDSGATPYPIYNAVSRVYYYDS